MWLRAFSIVIWSTMLLTNLETSFCILSSLFLVPDKIHYLIPCHWPYLLCWSQSIQRLATHLEIFTQHKYWSVGFKHLLSQELFLRFENFLNFIFKFNWLFHYFVIISWVLDNIWLKVKSHFNQLLFNLVQVRPQ